MPAYSGFSLVELLISLTLAAILGLGSLLALLDARQQVLAATQYTLASAALTDVANSLLAVAQRPTNRDGAVASLSPQSCVLADNCSTDQWLQHQLYQRLLQPQQLRLLPQLSFCLQGDLMQLSWRSSLPVAILPHSSACSFSNQRLSTSLRFAL